MGFYNDDHPNSCYPQQRPRSAWNASVSGTVVVHTVESIADKLPADFGAENAAHYISTRCDAGGYHVLVDSDSTIPMTRDDWMTWHTAANSANGYAWGISAACRTVDWDINEEWTRKTLTRMGAEIRAFAERNRLPLDKVARWLTKEQADRREVGLVLHGVIQPGDRSDAWKNHPQRAQLEAFLISAILGSTPPQEDEVTQDDKDDIINGLYAKLSADEYIDKVAQKVDDRFGNGLFQDQKQRGAAQFSVRDIGRALLTNGPTSGPDTPTIKDLLERLKNKFSLGR